MRWIAHARTLTHECTDGVAVEGRSVSDIPFITSYYFPLSRAAVNILFQRPVSALVLVFQLAFKQGLLWQGVNPARGISPSPTKLLLLAIECSSTNSWMHIIKKWPFMTALSRVLVKVETHACRHAVSRRQHKRVTNTGTDWNLYTSASPPFVR